MQFQYGEWLRATGGRQWSPQRKTKTGGSEDAGERNEHVVKTGEASPHREKKTAAQDEQGRNPSSMLVSEKGNNANQGRLLDFQQHIPVMAGTSEIIMERGVMGEVAEVNHELMVKGSDDSVNLKGVGKDVNGAGGTNIWPIPKWTRIVRMESGPVSSEENNFKEQLGKRKAMQDSKEGNYEDLDGVMLK